MVDLLLLLLLLFSTTITSASADAAKFVYAGCSQPKYAPDSAYQLNVDSLLSSLANAAGLSPFAKFTSSAASPSSPVYGLFQCRGDLSVPTCQSCVRSALNQLSPLCPSAAGAAVQLDGCLIRYGNDSFIGKLDTNLLYKKCGPVPSGGYDADLMGMRDDALAAIVAGGGTGGTYRSGAAGYVQAAAQCVGDLSADECYQCVSAAIQQLKSGCGYAVSGDVYLGKCFAKYYSDGAFSYSTPSHGDDYNHHHDNNNNDDAPKTWAIVIGVLAGLAIILVFLSFIRSSSSGK